MPGLGYGGPQLVIEVLSDDSSTHGPSTRRCIIHDALRVGFSWYSRFPANAFFTLRQDSLWNAMLVPGLDHIKIRYFDPSTNYGPVVVFSGRLGDPDESGEDVVWTAWSYLAELSLSLTGYRRLYPNKKIGTEIALPEWNDNSGSYLLYGAKVQTHSRLNHVVTGVFEDPTVSGSPIITDGRFGVIKVPRLLLYFDLTEMGRANTTNNVTYEITRALPHTINFWGDRGNALTAKRLLFPGNCIDFRHVPGVMNIRNKLSTIGESAAGGAVAIERDEPSGTYGHTAFGLMEDVFTIRTLAGIFGTSTTFDAQVKVTERALKEATQLTAALQVQVRPQLFQPFDGWDLEDTIRAQLKRGITNIDADYRIIGIRGTMDEAGYNQSLFIQPKAT